MAIICDSGELGPDGLYTFVDRRQLRDGIRNCNLDYNFDVLATADYPPGQTGPAGPAGPDGAVGVAGPTGADGPQGPQGVVGEQGPQGIQGIAGPDGVLSLDTIINGGGASSVYLFELLIEGGGA